MARGPIVPMRDSVRIYRPFDRRWLYWEQDSGLLLDRSPEYGKHVSAAIIWLTAARTACEKAASRNPKRFVKTPAPRIT